MCSLVGLEGILEEKPFRSLFNMCADSLLSDARQTIMCNAQHKELLRSARSQSVRILVVPWFGGERPQRI